jgi:hypothetical protein
MHRSLYFHCRHAQAQQNLIAYDTLYADWNKSSMVSKVGHIASKIKKLGNLLGIETVTVC